MMMRTMLCMVLVLLVGVWADAVPVTDDLIIHLKADAITGLSDGAAVSNWPDAAIGDGVNGTVSSVSGQSLPTWHAGVLGGHPVVRFSDDILSTAGQFSLPNPGAGITVVAVFSGDASGEQGERLAQIGDAAGNNGQVIGLDPSTNRTDSDGGCGFRFNNGRSLARTGNLMTTGFHLGIWQMAQGAQHQDASFSLDGQALVLDSINNPTNTTTLPAAGNIFSVGTGMVSGSWSAADLYTGDVAEILVYNARLTASQIKQVSDYLYEKYELNAPLPDGLIIHLKAESLALNHNAPVTQWADAAAADATDGTVSAVPGFGQPVYIADALNGHPAVRFTRPADLGSAPDSQKQALTSGTWSWDQAKGVTVFMVCTGGLATEQRAVQIGKSGGESFKSFGCDVSSLQSGTRYNNGYCLADSPFGYGQWHISTRQIAQGGGYGSVCYSVNETTYLLTTTNQLGRNMTFDAGSNDITLGAGWQSDALIDWYDGDIAEVLVYNKQLTPAQMRQVTTYLNTKYAVYEPARGKNFTVVAIPDSQGYVENSNQPASNNLNIEEMAWIANNAKDENIAFVSHEGDFMTTSNTSHYNLADTALKELLNTVPMGVVPGNHDYDNTNPSEGSNLWNSYFGYDTDYFRDKSWYGGICTNGPSDTRGMTSYQTFSTGDIDFLHIALECEPADAVLNWAKGILDAHPGWPTIVTTHSYLSASDGSYKAASIRAAPLNSPQQIWNEFIKVNPQIFMVLCGHSFNPGPSQRRIDDNNAGYPVYQMLADYQGINSGPNLGNGGGWIRLIDVSPLTNTVRVKTYSTSLNRYSTHSSLTDGSSWARNYGEFNYANAGAGSLIAESDSRASEFTIPFIYTRQLPRPAEMYGEHIEGLAKAFILDPSTDWLGGGVVFDPTYKVNGSYDRLYYVNRTTDSGTRGLYSATISDAASSGRLRLGAYSNPYGCTTDSSGDVYVCYNDDPAVIKVVDPIGSSTSHWSLIENYHSSGDDDIQSVMMVPAGFGGGFEAGTDLIMIDSGLDNDDNEAVVVLDAASTEGSPVYTVIWEDTSDYFTSDIRGCVSEVDGYCYIAPMVVQTAKLDGVTRPYINRVRADGVLQQIFLDVDISRDGAAYRIDDAIVVNPANGSVWLATSADGGNGTLYPRTIWRIDGVNAVAKGTNKFLATTTAEVTNAYLNIGINGMAWSPDGKSLALICPDTDKIYVYQASVPTTCADAIAKGYYLTYDFNSDCQVNYMDFADITVNDLAYFVDSWLDCIDPQLCDWLWP